MANGSRAARIYDEHILTLLSMFTIGLRRGTTRVHYFLHNLNMLPCLSQIVETLIFVLKLILEHWEVWHFISTGDLNFTWIAWLDAIYLLSPLLLVKSGTMDSLMIFGLPNLSRYSTGALKERIALPHGLANSLINSGIH